MKRDVTPCFSLLYYCVTFQRKLPLNIVPGYLRIVFKSQYALAVLCMFKRCVKDFLKSARSHQGLHNRIALRMTGTVGHQTQES